MIEKIQSNLTQNKNQENIIRKLQPYRSDFDQLSFLVMAIPVGKSKTLFQILELSLLFCKLGSHIFFSSPLIYLLVQLLRWSWTYLSRLNPSPLSLVGYSHYKVEIDWARKAFCSPCFSINCVIHQKRKKKFVNYKLSFIF